MPVRLEKLINSLRGEEVYNGLERVPYWLILIGVPSLGVYAATKMTLGEIGSDAEAVFVVTGFFAWLCYGRDLRRSTLFWLLLAAIIVPLCSWVLAYINHPLWAESSPKVHRLTHWFTLIPVAVWLGGKSRNTYLLWAIALVGLLAAPWIVGNGWPEWSRGLEGRRIDFNLHNAQHMGMLFATALLGLIAFSRRAILPLNRWLALRAILWAGLILFCLSAVIFSQSRGVWLGLLVVFIFSVGTASFVILHRKIGRLQTVKLSLGIGATIVLIVAITPFEQIVHKRLMKEDRAIVNFLEGDFSSLGQKSIGIRIHSWLEACSWIKERPLLGWGGHGRKLVIQQADTFSDGIKKRIGHLHNSYFDLMVNYGLSGLAVFLGLLTWLLLRARRALKAGKLPPDVASFGLIFLVFWLIVNCFESYMFYSSGGFVFSLISGGILSFIWKKKHVIDDPGE